MKTLIEFFSPDCRHCRQMGKELDDIEKEYTGLLKIKRINTSLFPDLSKIYHIKAVPTLILMSDGSEIRRHTGFQTKAALKDFIKTV